MKNLLVTVLIAGVLLFCGSCCKTEAPPDPCDDDCLKRPETGELIEDKTATVYIGANVLVVLETLEGNSSDHFLVCNMPEAFKINDYKVRITAKVTASCSENANGFDYIKVVNIYKY